MANAKPSSPSSVKAGPEIPAAALSRGGLNEAPPADQRAPAKAPSKLDDGPRRGDAGEYLPAAYKTSFTVGKGKDAKTHDLVRIDR